MAGQRGLCRPRRQDPGVGLAPMLVSSTSKLPPTRKKRLRRASILAQQCDRHKAHRLFLVCGILRSAIERLIPARPPCLHADAGRSRPAHREAGVFSRKNPNDPAGLFDFQNDHERASTYIHKFRTTFSCKFQEGKNQEGHRQAQGSLLEDLRVRQAAHRRAAAEDLRLIEEIDSKTTVVATQFETYPTPRRRSRRVDSPIRLRTSIRVTYRSNYGPHQLRTHRNARTRQN